MIDWTSFLAGAGVSAALAWVAHYYSLRRDIRKEYNDAARIIRSKLSAELTRLSPVVGGPTEAEWEVLEVRSNWLTRSRLKRAKTRCEVLKKQTNQDSFGQPHYTEKEKLKDALNTLRDLVKESVN